MNQSIDLNPNVSYIENNNNISNSSNNNNTSNNIGYRNDSQFVNKTSTIQIVDSADHAISNSSDNNIQTNDIPREDIEEFSFDFLSTYEMDPDYDLRRSLSHFMTERDENNNASENSMTGQYNEATKKIIERMREVSVVDISNVQDIAVTSRIKLKKMNLSDSGMFFVS